MPKRITVELGERSIDDAIRALREYERSIIDKCDRLSKAIADRIQSQSSSGFNSALVNDVIGGSMRQANVSVTVDPVNDGITAVIATGEDAVWVEFGAGVFHNGSVGTSPHPLGGELGFTIGSYGNGRGKGNTWGYMQDGALVLTHGTPAQMPLYNAVLSIAQDIAQIAGEVFKSD